MLPPVVSSHATPRKRGTRPQNTPRSNAPPFPVFLGNKLPSVICVRICVCVCLRHPHNRFVIATRHCAEGTARTLTVLIVSLFFYFRTYATRCYFSILGAMHSLHVLANVENIMMMRRSVSERRKYFLFM